MPTLEDLTVPELLARAKQLEGQAGTFAALAANPETREGLQRLLKTANPKLVIPEIDAADRLRGEFKVLQDDHAKLRNEILERDIRERLSTARSGAMQKYGLTEDDMQAVQALMIASDTNPEPLPSYDTAARVYKAQRQSAVPTPSSFVPPTYSMPEKEIWGKGIGNPAALDRAALGEAWNVWAELKTGKVPGLGAARGAPM